MSTGRRPARGDTEAASEARGHCEAGEVEAGEYEAGEYEDEGRVTGHEGEGPHHGGLGTGGRGTAKVQVIETTTAEPPEPADGTPVHPDAPPPGGRGVVGAPGVPDEPNGPDEPVEDHRSRVVRRVVDTVVVAACVGFVLWQLQPDLLLRNTTPAGGDMGAHVWGPAYLRDELLPNGQLAGWTKDWYAGFPAYQFYMVLPSLAIVVLNAGIHGAGALLPALAGAGLVALAVLRRHDARARNLAIAGAVVAFSLVGLPYGVAFKLITVSGLLTLPIACYAFGRLAGLGFPSPAVLAVASVPFLFYRGFTIYGGNIASTLAGEFAFSISLSLAVLYVGVVLRGLETGRLRAWAAVLLALTGLCHLIVAFWALTVTVIAVFVRFNRSRAPLLSGLAFAAAGVALAAIGLLLELAGWLSPAGLGAVAVGTVLLVVAGWQLSESVRWLSPTLVVGGLLSLWWVAPFYLRRAYLNDMGWKKLPRPTDYNYDGAEYDSYLDALFASLFPSETPDVDLRWAFFLALVGAGICIGLRLRAGIFLLLATVVMGMAFVWVPEGRLWNGRLLPFYYLTVLLLAGLAISETVRTITQLARSGRPEGVRAQAGIAVVTLLGMLVIVGLPLGALPGAQEEDGGGFSWPSFGPVQFHASPESFVPSWAEWNYTGYEGKPSYREYHDIVRTMEQLGEDENHGCGRAFWEYEEELDRYGTPMALMLLPFWTDGCIGSMEGLYFEASATTPFHFLTQVELSLNPSAAQRDLPYSTFDITRGVQHLQLLGVKYYMATSEQAIAAARSHGDLAEVAASGPWVVFEVEGSELVEPLDNEPAVLEGVDDSQAEWVEEPVDANGDFGGPAVRWFVDPNRWAVFLAQDGPDEWQRVSPTEEPEGRPVEAVEVTGIEEGEQSLSFDVSDVGTPVLVKTSYFPNWKVSGAEGPYRVAPNLMVVVPTDTHVEMHFGRTWVEYSSTSLSLLGVVGLVVLARRKPYAFTAARVRAQRRERELQASAAGPPAYGGPAGPWPVPGSPGGPPLPGMGTTVPGRGPANPWASGSGSPPGPPSGAPAGEADGNGALPPLPSASPVPPASPASPLSVDADGDRAADDTDDTDDTDGDGGDGGGPPVPDDRRPGPSP